MRDEKEIVKRIAAAIAATSMYGPVANRNAAAEIRGFKFGADAAERPIVEAFAALLEARADMKEETYRKTFGGTNA